MKRTESSKSGFQYFMAAACFNHYKYVLTPTPFVIFFQHGHRETTPKLAPWWVGKCRIAAMQLNGGGQRNWDRKVIHRNIWGLLICQFIQTLPTFSPSYLSQFFFLPLMKCVWFADTYDADDFVASIYLLPAIRRKKPLWKWYDSG